MTDERAMIAIERIEQALGRLEEAGRAAPAAGTGNREGAGSDGAGGDAAGAEELARLREAHRGLRSQVKGAIDRIDRLLAAGETR